MTDESKRLLALLQAKRDSPNRLDMIAKLKGNLTDNKAYLAITSPTTANNTAQIKALTRQVNRLIRLAINDLSASD